MPRDLQITKRNITSKYTVFDSFLVTYSTNPATLGKVLAYPWDPGFLQQLTAAKLQAPRIHQMGRQPNANSTQPINILTL